MTDQTHIRVIDGENFEKLDADTLRTILRTVRAANHHPAGDGYYHIYMPASVLDDVLTDPVLDEYFVNYALLSTKLPPVYGAIFHPTPVFPTGYLNVTVRGLPVVIE